MSRRFSIYIISFVVLFPLFGGGCSFPLFFQSPLGNKAEPLPRDSDRPKSKPFADDFDFSQLKEKEGIEKNTPESLKENVKNAQNPASATSAAEPDSISGEHFRALEQDLWTANAELFRWMERQREQGILPTTEKMVGRPEVAGAKKKTNNFDRFNRSAESKVQPGNFIARSKEAADQGPISLFRWFHGAVEELAMQSEKEQTKLIAARLLAQSPKKSVLRANLAILLARLDVEQTRPFLREAITNNAFSPSLRCAALESFANLPSTKSEELLALYGFYSEKEPQSNDANEFQPGVPDLVIETLRSLGNRIPLDSHPCFVQALRSRDSRIRLAATMLWRDHPPQRDHHRNANEYREVSCPGELVKLTTDPTDERIRIAAYHAIALWNHPDAVRFLKDGANDVRLSVRLAAIDALGGIDSQESVACLREQADHTSPKVRARTAIALRKLDRREELFRAADDKSSEVRREVAKGLVDSTDPATRELLKKMLADPSASVQKCAIESLAFWPSESATPILFQEMGGQSLVNREAATAVLTKRWAPAATFDFADTTTAARNRALEELKEQYYTSRREAGSESGANSDANSNSGSGFDSESWAESGAESRATSQGNGEPSSIAQASWANPRELDRLSLQKGEDAIAVLCDVRATQSERETAMQRLIALGPKVPLVVEYLIFEENRLIPEEIFRTVLPEVSPVFDAIIRLESDAVSERRLAANAIESESKTGPLGLLAASRIYDTGIRESDPLVLITLFRTFENTPGAYADRFGLFFLEHDSPEIRRRSCELLGQSEDVQMVEDLLPSLSDRTSSVVRSALHAIGILGDRYFKELNDSRGASSLSARSGQAEPDTVHITDELRKVLLQQDATLQLQAAVALCLWEDSEGGAALERLGNAKGDKIRLAVAQSAGRLSDPALIPLLITMLDDKGSIRAASLDSLPKLVGTDFGNPLESPSISTSEKIQNWKAWFTRREKTIPLPQFERPGQF